MCFCIPKYPPLFLFWLMTLVYVYSLFFLFLANISMKRLFLNVAISCRDTNLAPTYVYTNVFFQRQKVKITTPIKRFCFINISCRLKKFTENNHTILLKIEQTKTSLISHVLTKVYTNQNKCLQCIAVVKRKNYVFL